MPNFTSGCPSFAVLLAIRIVQESASSQPPPSANPLIAQIDGLPTEVTDLCTEPPMSPRGPIEGALRLLGGCNATIRHGFEQAMYLPDLDEDPPALAETVHQR